MGIGKRLAVGQYVEGILASNKLVLSRAITLVESTLPADMELAAQVLAALPADAGANSFRLGITGVPGVGKSTFIESFGLYLLNKGHKLAVLAVDPSSPISGGSIMGDKTRMEELGKEPGVFIRPSPAGSTLGGIALKTREAITICEAAGYDFIIVETVGVGQSEITVQAVTDFFLLLVLANAGDELQGIKRGIMEVADAVIINKADGDNKRAAQLAKLSYQNALHLLPPSKPFWQAQVLAHSSLDGDNHPIHDLMLDYCRLALNKGWLQAHRQQQAVEALHDFVQLQVLQQFYASQKDALLAAEKAITEGANPMLMAVGLLKGTGL